MNAVLQAIVREVRGGSQLSITQYGVLALVLDANGTVVLSVRNLAKDLNLARANVSRALAGLEKVDLVRKSPVKGDGRLIDVALTAKGRKLISQLVGAAP